MRLSNYYPEADDESFQVGRGGLVGPGADSHILNNFL